MISEILPGRRRVYEASVDPRRTAEIERPPAHRALPRRDGEPKRSPRMACSRPPCSTDRPSQRPAHRLHVAPKRDIVVRRSEGADREPVMA
jgi:hypothetical protein